MAEVKYKVLIADDEYWTREKIRNMIEWERYALEFLEPAEDGEDVLRKIEQNEPDILITDINMPFIDGVELIKIVHEKYPKIVVFVISGYDDFSYVKNSLVSGAINYLLKPVTKIDLVSALSKALDLISERQQSKEEEEHQRLEVQKASSLIQDRELSLLVEKEEAPFTPTIAITGDMNFAGYSLTLIKIHNLNEFMVEYQYDMNLISYRIKKEIKSIVGNEDILVFNHIYRSNEFVLITELDNTELKRIAEKILRYFSDVVKSPISIVVSEHSYSIESIHSAYIQSIAMLMTRGFDRANVILFCERNHEPSGEEVRISVSEETEKDLKHLLHSNNRRAIQELLRETIGLAYCSTQKWSYIRVKQTVKRVCNILEDYASDGSRTEDILGLESLIDYIDKVVEELDQLSLLAELDEVVAYVLEGQQEETTDTIAGVVRQAVRYVDEHYFEELSLTLLAERYHVESSYFSKMFRQETGKNLMLYIADKRIGKAKEYMKNEKLNLTEIAFMTGYDDYTYFNRVFRKLVGKSPREYRAEISKGGMPDATCEHW